MTGDASDASKAVESVGFPTDGLPTDGSVYDIANFGDGFSNDYSDVARSTHSGGRRNDRLTYGNRYGSDRHNHGHVRDPLWER